MGRPRAGRRGPLTQNVPLGSRVVSQKVNFLGQGNKGGSSRLPLGEERANILLLACCYQEGCVCAQHLLDKLTQPAPCLLRFQ